MDSGLSKTYKPSRGARALVLAFGLPGTLLTTWVGVALLSESVALGVAAFILAGLVFVWLVFITTSQLTLNDEQLVRTWLGGSRAIAVSRITRFEWGGGRGQLTLAIRAGKTWIVISSLSFKKEELHEVASSVLAARRLEGQPLWPPYAHVIDVEEMSKRKAALRHAA